MSDARDRDALLWESIGGDPEEFAVDGEGAAADVEYVPRREFDELRDTVRRLTRLVNRLQYQVDGESGYRSNSLTTLDKYTSMVEDGEDDPLSPSDLRAVRINQYWDDLAQPLPDGRLGVSTRKSSTKKHGPSQLKVDLQQLTGEELQSTQLYRAMKRVAELSGGSAEHDQYGRTKIVGGAYEYHVRTSPDNTDHGTYRVLIET